MPQKPGKQKQISTPEAEINFDYDPEAAALVN